jgi:hypothetical protein
MKLKELSAETISFFEAKITCRSCLKTIITYGTLSLYHIVERDGWEHDGYDWKCPDCINKKEVDAEAASK